MKLAATVCLFASAASAATPLASNTGGRDVSVALFSTHAVHAVTITPIGNHAWLARCAQCAREPLTTPFHLTTSGERLAGGTLRVRDDASNEALTATGLWHLRVNLPSHEIDIVLTLPSERYVASVLNAEASPNEPSESLKTLAILARTYSLNGTHYTAKPGHLPANLCDSTQCQAMGFGPISSAIEAATRATAGETLQFGSHYAEVFFSQSCGGLTEDASALWPSLPGVPYLQSHPDPYCLRRGPAAWHAEVSINDLHQIAQAEGWHLLQNIAAAHVTQRSASHRALRISFSDPTGSTSILSASSLRFGIGRALGWNRVRSDAYDLGVRDGSLIFDGHGHGHGVGLCQQGATQMASGGKSSREILAFYFPGAKVRISPTDHGWLETHAGPLTLRTTQPISADRQGSIAKVWEEARKRFPPHQALSPQITFSPSVEIFRQLTAEPGWVLATTRGQIIVLQPDYVLHSHAPYSNDAILHEMLHVLVESEATQLAPLWLREGLVEVLTGEPTSADTMEAQDIETALQHPDSLLASQRAHRAAAARVHALNDRYGISAVRSWLVSGVPAGVA